MKLPRILVVEDEVVLAKALARQLTKLGYEVATIVTEGEEAVEQALSDPPDLVLMDIELGGRMDGIDAAYEIGSSLHIPVVFLTAYADSHLLERAKRVEPFGYLIKPTIERELQSTLEMALCRAKAENELVEANEKWERTFDAVPDLIMILDNKHRIVRANKASEDRLGLPREDIVGQECYRLFHNSDTPPSSCPHAALLDSGKEHTAEITEDLLGGTFDVSVSPLPDRDGRLMGSVHVARDVTQRKRAQEDLVQLIDEIKHFAYYVSHDLRAPVSSLKGFSSELRFGIDRIRSMIHKVLPLLDSKDQTLMASTLEGDITEALTFIDSSVARMDKLIEAILDLSRSGHRHLHFERMNMNDLAEEVLTTLSHQIAERDVNVVVNRLPETVADRISMEQIMTNLLGNAVKYLDPNRPGEVAISGHHFPDENVYVVRDNGRGIDRTHVTQIFHVFQRVGKQDVPGEGMGLAHVRTLVRRHGGSLSCESEPGVGSSFTFTISNRLDEGGLTS